MKRTIRYRLLCRLLLSIRPKNLDVIVTPDEADDGYLVFIMPDIILRGHRP